MFAKRFGDCTTSPGGTQASVENATGYADRYALEAGFRRCASPAGVPNARAARFARDVPESMAPPAWRLYKVLYAAKFPRSRRVKSCRFAESAPTFESLRGALFNEVFVHQYAARASALAFLLMSVWLAPAASYSNRVAMTESITRAIEARKHMLATGPADKWPCEQSETVSRPWSFNTVLDCVAGLFLFGSARNKPCPRDMMLQLRLAGTKPGVGERHFAFPSDCCPWSTSDGMFVTGNEVSETDREAVCSTLAGEWKNFEGAFVRGETSGYARRIPGRPVRVSLGGVGGNRLLVLTPEPASWELRAKVTSNHRNVRLASFVAVDELKSPKGSLAQRATQPPASGNMAVCSSKNSAQFELPLMWSPRMIRTRGLGPFVNGNIVEEE